MSEMSCSESNLISFSSCHDIWNLSLSAPAVKPFKRTLKWLTWHLCLVLLMSVSPSYPPPVPSTLCSSLLSRRANLKTSSLMFKAKGLESFPPTTQTSPSKENINWLKKIIRNGHKHRKTFPEGCSKLLAYNMVLGNVTWALV